MQQNPTFGNKFICSNFLDIQMLQCLYCKLENSQPIFAIKIKPHNILWQANSDKSDTDLNLILYLVLESRHLNCNLQISKN